jgi:hypothetical protein
MTLENSGEVIVLLAKALNPFSISPIICCHNASGSLPLSAIGVLLQPDPSVAPYHTLTRERSTSPRERANGTAAGGPALVDMSIITAMMFAFRFVGRAINDKGMR